MKLRVTDATLLQQRLRYAADHAEIHKHIGVYVITLSNKTSFPDNCLNNEVTLDQLYPTRGSHEAQSKVLCGPMWVSVKVSYILTTSPCFDNLEFEILTQVVLSATLTRLLPLQL